MTAPPRHRRREVSRIEGFSDAVFGFAVTLLVVSLEVPRTFHDLLLMMRGFPAFAVSFAMLFMLWWRHYRFFRRYDLEDPFVITMTAFLLFVVLFYVYPLKFLWSFVFSQAIEGGAPKAIERAEIYMLFEIYGAGVAAAYGLLAALYLHAYRRRAELDLTPVEVMDTRVDIYSNISLAGIGLISAILAAVLNLVAPQLVGIAGLMYFLFGVSEWTLGAYRGRLQRRMMER